MKTFRVLCLATVLWVWGAEAKAASDPRFLVRVPTPEVLSDRSLSFETIGNYFISRPSARSLDQARWGPDVTVSAGFKDRYEVGVSGSSAKSSLDGYAGHVRMRLVHEQAQRPAIGIGVMDLASERYARAAGLPPVTRTPEYASSRGTPSVYAVIGKQMPSFGRIVLGIGTGRFAGRGLTNRYAHGLLAGFEAQLPPPMSYLAEFDGRNVNMGLRAAFSEVRSKGLAMSFTGRLALKYLQNLRASSWGMGLRPALSADLVFSVRPVARHIASMGKTSSRSSRATNPGEEKPRKAVKTERGVKSSTSSRAKVKVKPAG